MPDARIDATPSPAGFSRWEELLGVIRASFAYMDGIIDPPSSAHRLAPRSLAVKARDEVCFLATLEEAVTTKVVPNRSPQGPNYRIWNLPPPLTLPHKGEGHIAMVPPTLETSTILAETATQASPPPCGEGAGSATVAISVCDSPGTQGGGIGGEGGRPSSSQPGDMSKIIGCAFLAERADRFYLGKLAVLPAYQGKGVARSLLNAAEVYAIHAGKPAIELQTRVELVANHRFFASQGFEETARTAHEGFDRPTSITMLKRLA